MSSSVSHTSIRDDLSVDGGSLLDTFLFAKHTLYLCVCLCVFYRTAEPRPRAGEGGRPVAVGRFGHHVRRRTSV